ncbi:flagellar hook-length control protein FliK [Phorcysia thermohydrogeniphila]|uniref:Flagellar hook-length control protein FliK n=1 Tax=Phorcysia thermohydrogeniphila TaxID=936138 RepID=A0A4R1GF86_9BACT|nr:flagellar hook-length control protein FliK [Phorcysia thermohydrogeniphila]TCK05345.1 hypothetical protein CLV27_0772 [Phorcysia thermohydrogeniphila]
MEIRRIEGIVPLEGISRNLPQKLENFSYHDMKKLLSTISSGAQKKGVEEELSSLLIKATFEGFTPEGKAKLRSGHLILIADVEVNREFKIGEELLFRLKSLHPRIELSLVKEEELLETVLGKLRLLLPKFSADRVLLTLEVLKNPKVLSFLANYVSLHYPELKEEFGKFLKGISNSLSKTFFSPFSLFSLLLLLEDDVFESVKEELPEKLTKGSIKELVTSFLSLQSVFVVSGIVVFPFIFDEEFKGDVYFAPKEDDIQKVYVEVETRFGRLGIFIQLLNESLSVEAVTESEELRGILRKSEESFRRELEEEGFKLVLFRVSDDLSYGDEKKREIFKGERGVTVDFSA